MLWLHVLLKKKLLLTICDPVMKTLLTCNNGSGGIDSTNHDFIFIPGSNQPPRFLNYFFSTYLLIYEDMPVGESQVRTLIYVKKKSVYIYFFVTLKGYKILHFNGNSADIFCYLHAALMSTIDILLLTVLKSPVFIIHVLL